MDLTRYFPIFVSIGDAGSCFTGVNEPVVVSGGGVMVSGGELGICDFEHIPLGGEDPEQVDENGNPIVDPENPEEEPNADVSGILDSLRDLFE